MPEERRHQRIHEGHCSFLTEAERKFVTPTTIRTTMGLVGTPDEILERVDDLERRGLKEIVLLPDFNRRREVFSDFAKHVIVPHHAA
jgi:alkanesulfonate monooxygenase SsuD/methylene tetrahydromethanopterin reductase-like flavin-dependent oxidoreductase (luciferase family)